MSGTTASDWRDRSGFCGVDMLNRPSGALTPAQRVTLKAVTEYTKMQHDLLGAFADRYEAFPAELRLAHTRATAALRVLLGRYRMDDPTAGLEPGVFADPRVQADYERLIAYGSTGRAAALCAVREIAVRAAAGVERALIALDAPDVQDIYQRILTSARHQVRRAQAWSGP